MVTETSHYNCLGSRTTESVSNVVGYVDSAALYTLTKLTGSAFDAHRKQICVNDPSDCVLSCGNQ